MQEVLLSTSRATDQTTVVMCDSERCLLVQSRPHHETTTPPHVLLLHLHTEHKTTKSLSTSLCISHILNIMLIHKTMHMDYVHISTTQYL